MRETFGRLEVPTSYQRRSDPRSLMPIPRDAHDLGSGSRAKGIASLSAVRTAWSWPRSRPERRGPAGCRHDVANRVTSKSGRTGKAPTASRGKRGTAALSRADGRRSATIGLGRSQDGNVNAAPTTRGQADSMGFSPPVTFGGENSGTVMSGGETEAGERRAAAMPRRPRRPRASQRLLRKGRELPPTALQVLPSERR